VEFILESAGATAGSVRRAGRDGTLARAAAWARWTLEAEEDVELPSGFARTRALSLLTRGPVVPLGPALEARLRARFGLRAAAAAAAVHRLQCAGLIVAPSGRPSRLDNDLGRTGAWSSEEAEWLGETARRDLGALLDDLARLGGECPAAEAAPVFVSWLGGRKPGRLSAWISDGGEGAAFAPRRQAGRFARDDAALAALARRLFGVPELRPGQADGIAALLSGRDLSLALPTGGGKSLVFQLASLLCPGTALVVAPLRALLRDQARRLAENGIGNVGLLVGDDEDSTRRGLAELAAGRLTLALAAPERLDSAAFRRALRGAAETCGISFVAVDEAHCAARRGHDWRPAYRAFGARLRDWASMEGRVPAVAALSGGSSGAALDEAGRVLGLVSPEIVRAGTPRSNLEFFVRRGSAPDHAARLRDLLTRVVPDGRFGPGIVFCPRVDGPLGAAAVAEDLIWSEGVDVAAYTGRPPVGADAAAWAAAKRRAADDFLGGRRGLLCATRAFGLGVDRSDVRFTVHLGLPASLEEFYQQAGRAGRDGDRAGCWILLQILSERRARRWARMPLEALRAEIAGLKPDRRDDASRAYAFHLAAFPGRDAELRDAELALLAAGDPMEPGDVHVGMPGEDADALTRAMLRLEETGAFSLISRTAHGWRARRAGGWSAKNVLAAAGEGISRDYAAVEPSRRASLAELIELALSSDPGTALAARLTAIRR